MRDLLTHQSGIGFIRLRKPLEYYISKYGSAIYGLEKLFLLMEKQHNRGQDAAGIGAVKLHMPAGRPYMFRERLLQSDGLSCLFGSKIEAFREFLAKSRIDAHDAEGIKAAFDYAAEIYLGHVSYHSGNNLSKETCHPYSRKSTWPTRNLMLAGNFNITNIEALNHKLVERGQHPISDADTQTLLEEIGYQLDEEHSRIYRELRDSQVARESIPGVISERLDLISVLKKATRGWDGGYALVGLVGNGDAFAFRDPAGIRPAFYYQDEEIVAVASERAALLTAFDLEPSQVQELRPGHALIIRSDNRIIEEPYCEGTPVKQCSFERIYFSRGNDPEIYKERKALGAALMPMVLESLGNKLENAVISFIPNTAEVAYFGLLEALKNHWIKSLESQILELSSKNQLTPGALNNLLTSPLPQAEKIAHKDIKIRNFMIEQSVRDQLASHVYDITYGVVTPKDTLVCIDDSVVRGNALKESILRILSRTRPKKIVIASTAPQIRYPDFYGIAMSRIDNLIAFQAAIALLKERKQLDLLKKVYDLCVAQKEKPAADVTNYVKMVYEPFTADEISSKIAQLVHPGVDSKIEIQLIFQKIETLHQAIPRHKGDWYFTGNYPTSGGYASLNQAFIEYYETLMK